MTLIDNNGRVITRQELASSYASDLRTYCQFTSEQIDQRLWERYPDVMRYWDAVESERKHT